MTSPAELEQTPPETLSENAPEGAASSPPASPAATPASHDTAAPEALVKFMLQGWAPPLATLPEPLEHAAAFEARRRKLSEKFPGEALIVPSGHLKVRSNDDHYRFRPSSDFYYLTGCLEPDCVLVLLPKDGGGHRDVLFTEPNPGRSDKAFFTDRIKGALWVGPRLGVPESKARFAVEECRPLEELDKALDDVKKGAHRVARGHSAKVDDALPAEGDGPKEKHKELSTFLSEMRLLKDALEVEELRAVIASTARGFEDVIERLPVAKSERELEGTFNLRARVEGNDVGYGTIAATGHHACTLHYTKNDGRIRKKDLLLLDAGVEGNSLYTADITRTLPIRGTFTKAQRTIYKLVYKAQQAALAEVKPGADFMDPNKAAMRVLAEGLEKLEILKDAEAALAEEKQFYKRYSLHNVSHMLGLDVHDCAQARKEVYKLGKLRAGMVLTVEPGLYFQEDDLTVPEVYRGIGVRIEDDVLVTEDGHENLSAHIPSQVDEVEAWMARVWKGKKR